MAMMKHLLLIPTMSYRKRKNIALACEPCRVRKVRCDGAEPICSSCARRNDPCFYPADRPKKRLDNRYIRQVRDNSPCPEGSRLDLAASEDDNISLETPAVAVENGKQESSNTPVATLSTKAFSTSEIRQDDQNENDKGHSPNEYWSQNQLTAMGIASEQPSGGSESQNEFFGNSSVASFLKQITVSAASNFEGASSGTGRGKVGKSSFIISAHDLPQRQLGDYLVECYFDKFHCLYPFIHRHSFYRAYTNLWSSQLIAEEKTPSLGIGLGDPTVQSSTFLCALNMILALGCQFSQLEPSVRQAASADFFQRSQKFLNVIDLDKGDLALIQTLLLTATYLQGGESPSKCWNMIGLACRVAQGLGMHSLKADRNRKSAEIQMRRRVWHGCIMLDLASSMMLGRPPMTNASVVPLPQAIDDEDLDSSGHTSHNTPRTSRSEFYVQTLQLHTILRKVLLEVYEPWENLTVSDHLEQIKVEHNHAQTVMKLDAELLAFISKVPVALQWKKPPELSEQFRRESSLLRARFLHLRILLLRPTLVRLYRTYPTSHEQGDSIHTNSEGSGAGSGSTLFLDFSLSCSTHCVEAAIELSHLMNEISRTELASVWWYNVFYTFSAGVVLAIAQTIPVLTSRFPEQALTDAWQSCIHCLETLSSCTSTAKVCADCLHTITSQYSHQSSENGPRIPSYEAWEPETNEMGLFDPLQPESSSIFGGVPTGSLLDMACDDFWLTALDLPIY
ncbi:hypothetical protein P170DRAFT_479009 [Aspergillus steynii IBT 23096]|uniref:Zn(2)-C6 fungal-type domain-containing protein n=1 Tax=Aspergillus steynii IBT 23096 TaxID=1392250 RepID=A0A2I2FZM6_9EURO|nr:uncharacterized protein P170DRAFT_479009 [Aspergillus steynii IBT 23096]PLB46090.1 hypothetical protein P170DRAFT_479009 [Aspergillus steynii IBT 23096]